MWWWCYLLGGTGNVTHCTFNNNTAWYYGGAIFRGCYRGVTGNVTHCTFNNNTARNYGGAIFWNSENGNVTHCTFNNNAVEYGGGAIYWGSYWGGTSNVTHCTFNNNTAVNWGGAIFWDSENGNVTHCTFNNNTARNYGGAIFWNSENGNVTHCTFNNNTARYYGGAIYLNATGSIINCSFINNKYVKSNGIYAAEDLTINEGKGIVDVVHSDKLSGISIIVLGNETCHYLPNQNVDLIGKIMSGDLTIVDATNKLSFNVGGTTYSGSQVGIREEDGAYYVIGYTIPVTETNILANASYPKAAAGTPVKTGRIITKNDLSITMEAGDIVKYFRNGTQYQVFLKDAAGNPVAGGKIVVSFVSSKGGKASQYAIVTNADGVATLAINANIGTYYVNATYGKSSISNKITVLKATYSIKAEDIFMGFKDGSKYTVKVVDPQGNPVTGQKVSVTIASSKWSKKVIYTIVTGKDGVARLALGLGAGQYTFTAEYGSDSATSKVAVFSGKHRLITNNLVKYYKNGTQYTVKVTDLKGNPLAGQKVVVTLNTRTGAKMASYTITTNKDGVATLAINLNPNQYTIKASIGSDSVQNTINVLPTLTAETLTKTVNQAGNLVAKLVDGHGKAVSGKAVTFTINSKVYTKTTNANGLATLPIGLGVGTWTITIANPATGVKTTAKVIVTKAKP